MGHLGLETCLEMLWPGKADISIEMRAQKPIILNIGIPAFAIVNFAI